MVDNAEDVQCESNETLVEIDLQSRNYENVDLFLKCSIASP